MVKSSSVSFVLIIYYFFINAICITNCDIVTISTHDLGLKLDDSANVTLKFTLESPLNAELNLIVQHKDLVKVSPSIINVSNVKSGDEIPLTVTAIGAGNSLIEANLTEDSVSESLKDVFLRVKIFKNPALDTFSLAIGWIYFVAWSVSFYPQIYENYKRKSVVGLNFDFLALNLIGFALYSFFNIGLYAIPEIEQEYFNRYPKGLNPVQINDIVFAIHATIVTIATIAQCFIYERQDQRVSKTAIGIMSFFALFLFISVILAATSVIHWLDFLFFCSYVKLTITLIKYIPQAYLNYKRKSTVGWSIGNIFLDFTGGSLSMLQMIVLSYNYDDWVSIFGDPTKFGLGLFSVAFDIFFILQHYVFYRHSNYDEQS